MVMMMLMAIMPIANDDDDDDYDAEIQGGQAILCQLLRRTLC